MMADHIPFITSTQSLKLVRNIYSDSNIVRVSLDVAQKLTLSSEVKLWIDPGVDGFHDFASRSEESAWYALMKSVPGFDKIGASGFIAKPNPAIIQLFINTILDRTAKLNPAWITVPQLPFINDSSLRNKINRALAMATGRWKSAEGFTGVLILPLIFTHAEQTKGKTQRTPRLHQAKRCYHESQADGYWVVDTTLIEETGSVALRNKRFKSMIDLHQELNNQISTRIRIAGPYWGMNLVLWSRGLVDFPAIGVGGTYQYYMPGGHSHAASARVGIGPLRRRVGVPLLSSWLAKTMKIIGPSHPAYPEMDKIQKQLHLLRDPDTARIQVANFYKKWFETISSVPATGRSFALFQDLSQSFALGRSLPDFANEGAARKAESVVEPLMVNCL